MVRRILAVIAGIVVSFVIIYAMELAGQALWHLPEGVKPDDYERMSAWIATLPVTAFLFLLLGYALGAFAGGLVASLIAGRSTAVPAVVVGALLAAASFISALSMPGPTAVYIASVLICLVFAWLGWRAVARRVRVREVA